MIVTVVGTLVSTETSNDESDPKMNRSVLKSARSPSNVENIRVSVETTTVLLSSHLTNSFILVKYTSIAPPLRSPFPKAKYSTKEKKVED